MAITSEMVTTLIKVPNAVLVDRYTKQLAHILGVDEKSIELELIKVRDKLSARKKPSREEETQGPERQARVPFQLEYAIIALMVEDAALARQAIESLSGDDFQSGETSDIFERMQTCLTDGKPATFRQVMHWELSDLLKSYISAHSYEQLELSEKHHALEHCIGQLKKRQRQSKLTEIQRLIRIAEQKGDHESVTALLQQFQDLARMQQSKA